MDVSGEHFPRLWSALASCLRVFVSSCLWIRKLPQCRDASSRWHFQDISMQLPEQAKQSRAQWGRMLSVRGSFPCEASKSADQLHWPIGLSQVWSMPQELCQDYADNPGVTWDCPASGLDWIWTLEVEGKTWQLLSCWTRNLWHFSFCGNLKVNALDLLFQFIRLVNYQNE